MVTFFSILKEEFRTSRWEDPTYSKPRTLDRISLSFHCAERVEIVRRDLVLLAESKATFEELKATG